MASASFSVPRWFDLHTHFRQGPSLRTYISDHLSMGCAGALAMPNTIPPMSRIAGPETKEARSIESYQAELKDAGAHAFEKLITPLYLTRETTAADIHEGKKSGLLEAAKYSPPHGTTNADFGVPMEEWLGGDVFRAMEETGTVLCIHGEDHTLMGADYFDAETNAEERFYKEMMPRLVETHPNLRITCEHLTTKEAVEFVSSSGPNVAATITPQHLLLTVGTLLQGLNYHLYCLPLVKFEQDRDALRQAIAEPGQTKFFAGTDSAPHQNKVLDGKCAAGCYTSGCAPQLYAMIFEEAGVDLNSSEGIESFRAFLSTNGPLHYDFPASEKTFTLTKSSEPLPLPAPSETPDGSVIPMPTGLNIPLTWSLDLG